MYKWQLTCTNMRKAGMLGLGLGVVINIFKV